MKNDLSAAITANANESSGVVDTAIASIDASDYSCVSSSDSDEQVETFVDGLSASVKDDDVTPNDDNDDNTATASIEKAGLFSDFNDNYDLRFDATIESLEAASLSSDSSQSAGVAMHKRKDLTSI